MRIRRTPQNIVLVEDDYLQAELIRTCLKLAFPDSSVERIKTELEFRSRLEELAAAPPDLIILDVLLKWTDPSRDLCKPPDEIQSEGYFRAGFRCAQLLLKRKETKHVPIIIYTILERDDLSADIPHVPRHVVYLRKEPEPESLTAEILNLLNGDDGMAVN